MSTRKMTDQEIQEHKVTLIMAGAVGQNSVKCQRCGNITHIPNNGVFDNNLFHVHSCVKCDQGSCWG